MPPLFGLGLGSCGSGEGAAELATGFTALGARLIFTGGGGVGAIGGAGAGGGGAGATASIHSGGSGVRAALPDARPLNTKSTSAACSAADTTKQIAKAPGLRTTPCTYQMRGR